MELSPGLAMVACRPGSAMHLGHVAWGYSDPRGAQTEMTAGSVEDSRGLPYAPPDVMEFWQESVPVSETDRLAQRLILLGYEEFKAWTVGDPKPDAAAEVALAQSRKSYFVCGNNCLDTVHRILTAYGASAQHLHSPRHPSSWIPNAWYRSIPVESLPLSSLSRVAGSLRRRDAQRIGG